MGERKSGRRRAITTAHRRECEQLDGTSRARRHPIALMLVPQSLVFEVDQIADRERRHKARSLLACYVAYLELQDEAPQFATRAAALARELRRLGISGTLPPLTGEKIQVFSSWSGECGVGSA